MERKTRIDPFHGQIISSYLKTKNDFINFICIKKDFEFILDRFRINPIPVTNETRNLFKFIDTQQLFTDSRNEIILEDIEILQFNFEMSYSECLEIKEKNETYGQLKFKKVVYSKKDREKYGNNIPQEVTILGDNCFDHCEITEIVIPSNVKEIKEGCFSDCINVKHFVIPNSVTKILHYAFKSCSQLTSITLSTNIEEFPRKMFMNCEKLQCIEISSHLKVLKSNCFDNCTSLSEIIIPDSVQCIEEECFRNCFSLKKVIVPSSVTFIKSHCFEDCYLLDELIIKNNKCKIEWPIIDGCTTLKKLQIPLINGYSPFIPHENERLILERNGIKIFHSKKDPIENRELNSKQFVDDEHLGFDIQFHMRENNYSSLYIPTTVTKINSIDRQWFYHSNDLKEIILPPNILFYSKIGIFSNRKNNQHRYIKFSDGKTLIENLISYSDSKIFEENGIHCENIILTSDDKVLQFPTNCNVIIENWNDNNYKLKEIPSNVVEIENFHFLDESITSLEIPSTITRCGNWCFHKCHLPNLVELKCYKHHVCDKYEFFDELTQLTKIEIIDGSLDDIVVSYDYHLKMKEKGIILNNVCYSRNDNWKHGYILPSNVKSICNYSTEINLMNGLNENKIEIRGMNEKIKVFEIPTYQTRIYNEMFRYCCHLTYIKLHEGIKEIGNKAFYYCISLKSISIPSSVTFFGEKCFYCCDSLTRIEYEGEIDDNCFMNCYLLETIPKIKSLQPGNFSHCSFITSISLNDSIKKIPGSCFFRCYSLSNINIPSCCEEIDSFAFKHCISLKKVIIPKSVKKINDGAFYGCVNLEQIVIENEDIEIGYDAFGECLSLKEIIIKGKKITEYKYEVNYSQMKGYEEIGIECNDIVIRREDVKKYGIEIMNDSRVHRIHDNCFREYEEVVELVIPTHINTLGMYSFSNCSKLTRVIIPTSIKTIPYYCFEHCSRLVDVRIPEGIVFERNCFWKCLSLPDELRRTLHISDEIHCDHFERRRCYFSFSSDDDDF